MSSNIAKYLNSIPIQPKQAGWKTEIASILNPLNLVGSPIGALSAAITPTRTEAEQIDAEKETWKNILQPGRGAYNSWKRMGYDRHGEDGAGEASEGDHTLSEILGSNLNPLNLVGVPIGGTAALYTPTRSVAEQIEHDKGDHTALNWLAPGYAPYQYYKRLGSSMRGEGSASAKADKEDKEDKADKEDEKDKEKKEAAVGLLCKVAGISDMWNNLTEAQRQAIVGGAGGMVVGGGLGALINEDDRLMGAGVGAGIGGLTGGVGGYLKGKGDASADEAAGLKLNLKDTNAELSDTWQALIDSNKDLRGARKTMSDFAEGDQMKRLTDKQNELVSALDTATTEANKSITGKLQTGAGRIYEGAKGLKDEAALALTSEEAKQKIIDDYLKNNPK